MAGASYDAERGITSFAQAQTKVQNATTETTRVTKELTEAIDEQAKAFESARSYIINSLGGAGGEQMRTAAGEGLALYRDMAGNQQFYRPGSEPAGYSLLFNPSTAFGGAQAPEGGAGMTVAPVTININGIVTDPVATGQAVADALNAAATQSGPVLLSGVVQ